MPRENKDTVLLSEWKF